MALAEIKTDTQPYEPPMHLGGVYSFKIEVLNFHVVKFVSFLLCLMLFVLY